MTRFAAIALPAILVSCTSAQLTTASTDAQAICQDIQAIEAGADGLNLVPAVATTEGYLGTACDASKLASASLPWLAQVESNLKATVATAAPKS